MLNDEDESGLPNYLRAWRKFRGMSGGKLAAALGTSKSQISALETTDRLSPSWQRRIAVVLKCRPGDLVDNHPHDVDFALRELLEKATPEELKRIERVAEALVNYDAKGGDPPEALPSRKAIGG